MQGNEGFKIYVKFSFSFFQLFFVFSSLFTSQFFSASLLHFLFFSSVFQILPSLSVFTWTWLCKFFSSHPLFLKISSFYRQCSAKLPLQRWVAFFFLRWQACRWLACRRLVQGLVGGGRWFAAAVCKKEVCFWGQSAIWSLNFNYPNCTPNWIWTYDFVRLYPRQNFRY